MAGVIVLIPGMLPQAVVFEAFSLNMVQDENRSTTPHLSPDIAYVVKNEGQSPDDINLSAYNVFRHVGTGSYNVKAMKKTPAAVKNPIQKR